MPRILAFQQEREGHIQKLLEEPELCDTQRRLDKAFGSEKDFEISIAQERAKN